MSWNADKSSSDPKFLQFLSSNIQIALPSWKRSASRLLCFKTNLTKIFPNTNSTSASWSSCVKYCWFQLNISGCGGGPFLMQDTCWIRGTFPAEEQDTCEITWISGCEIDNQVGTAGKLQQSLLTELVPLMHLVRRQAADIWDQLGLLKGLKQISTRQSEKCGSIHKRLNIPDQWPWRHFSHWPWEGAGDAITCKNHIDCIYCGFLPQLVHRPSLDFDIDYSHAFVKRKKGSGDGDGLGDLSDIFPDSPSLSSLLRHWSVP